MALLPDVRDHVGYASLGEGFCYLNMSAKPVAALSLVWTVVLTVAMLVLTGTLLLRLWRGLPRNSAGFATLFLLLVTYIGTWILWPVGGIIALSGHTHPKGFMIAGGILGHAQALVNPILYGTLWRRHFLAAYCYDAPADACIGAEPEASQANKVHPDTDTGAELGA